MSHSTYKLQEFQATYVISVAAEENLQTIVKSIKMHLVGPRNQNSKHLSCMYIHNNITMLLYGCLTLNVSILITMIPCIL